MKIVSIGHSFKLLALGIVIAINTAGFSPVSAQESDEEVSEIGWTSRISSMGLNEKKNIGKKYQFNCQPAKKDFTHAPIWGTKFYTVNSGICSTAVHWGMLDPGRGGEITIKLVKGKNFYTGSIKNDVTSEDHRGDNMSFVFVGEPRIEEEVNKDNDKNRRQPSAIERVLRDGFQRGVERTIEKAIADILD